MISLMKMMLVCALWWLLCSAYIPRMQWSGWFWTKVAFALFSSFSSCFWSRLPSSLPELNAAALLKQNEAQLSLYKAFFSTDRTFLMGQKRSEMGWICLDVQVFCKKKSKDFILSAEEFLCFRHVFKVKTLHQFSYKYGNMETLLTWEPKEKHSVFSQLTWMERRFIEGRGCVVVIGQPLKLRKKEKDHMI